MTSIIAPRPSGSFPVLAFRVVGLLYEPELALWAVFILLTPIYFFWNGLPQLADFAALLVMPLMARRGFPRLPGALRVTIVTLFAFAIYAAGANLIWGLLLAGREVKKVGPIAFAGFYLFNTYIFATCLYLYRAHGRRFLIVTVWGTVAALLLQLVLYIITGGSDTFRERLFFNSPNQLGYWSLLSACIVAFGFQRALVPVWLAGGGLATATLFAALSLSKAAIIGSIAVAVVAAARKPLLLAVTAGVVFLGMAARDPTELIEKVIDRMNDMGTQGDDTFEGRGYSRIEMHPEYLVLGAGEVGHDRHGDFGGELHSSFGTVFFSYGVAGSVIFLFFLWRTTRLLRPNDLLFLAPVFLYSITHQGLRFRLFWVFLAFVAATGYEARLRAKRKVGRR